MAEPPANQPTSDAPGIAARRNSPAGENRGSPLLRRLADVLLSRQAIQRPALARETNLSLQVVADLLAELERRGLVVVNGRFTGMPGRSNLTYALAAGAAAALALRVSEQQIEATLCDLRGATLASESARRDRGELSDEVGAALRRLCETAGIERYRLGAAHVGLPASAAAHAPQISAELLAQCGCHARIDIDVELSQSVRAEAAHRELLGTLFGVVQRG